MKPGNVRLRYTDASQTRTGCANAAASSRLAFVLLASFIPARLLAKSGKFKLFLTFNKLIVYCFLLNLFSPQPANIEKLKLNDFIFKHLQNNPDIDFPNKFPILHQDGGRSE